MGKRKMKIEDIARSVVQQYLINVKDRDMEDLQKEADKLIGYLTAAGLEIKARGR